MLWVLWTKPLPARSGSTVRIFSQCRRKTDRVPAGNTSVFIFQSFNLIPELNVEQNITFPLLLDYKQPDQRFVNELLNVLGLTERRHHLPSQLSGGQQQRVAIGRALVTRPALILADEPTGNLDSKNSQEVLALLQTMSAKYQQTILMITHNKNHASAADRIFNMSDGVLKSWGRAGNETLPRLGFYLQSRFTAGKAA